MEETLTAAGANVAQTLIDPMGWPQVDTSGSGKAYRTELSPLSFLRRSARVFPDKVAVVHGERRMTYGSSRNGRTV